VTAEAKRARVCASFGGSAGLFGVSAGWARLLSGHDSRAGQSRNDQADREKRPYGGNLFSLRRVKKP